MQSDHAALVLFPLHSAPELVQSSVVTITWKLAMHLLCCLPTWKYCWICMEHCTLYCILYSGKVNLEEFSTRYWNDSLLLLKQRVRSCAHSCSQDLQLRKTLKVLLIRFTRLRKLAINLGKILGPSSTSFDILLPNLQQNVLDFCHVLLMHLKINCLCLVSQGKAMYFMAVFGAKYFNNGCYTQATFLELLQKQVL